MSLALCIQRQAAAVGIFMRFFRLGILALEVGERNVQRFVAEPDANRVHGPQPGVNFGIADKAS
jgi:hypothetical protein